REHLRGRVDAPDAGEASLGQHPGELPGPAADVEHTAASQVRLTNDDFEDLEPVLVDRAQPLVVGGPGVEIRSDRSSPHRWTLPQPGFTVAAAKPPRPPGRHRKPQATPKSGVRDELVRIRQR